MSVLNQIRKLFINRFFEKLLVKATRGKSPNSFFSKIVPSNYLYKPNSFRKFKHKGINLFVDLHDYVGHYYYYGFKDANIDQLFSYVKPGYTIIDVGANIGFTTLVFAKLTGENGKVISYEPDPINYENCLNNIRSNPFSNIGLKKLGLGSTSGEFELVVITESNRGGNRIQIGENKNNSNLIKVTTLDSEVLTEKKIDLIKIDVEGFEFEVLKGAKQVLKRDYPIVFCEIDDNYLKLQGSSIKELLSFMINDIGFDIVKDANTGLIIDLDNNFNNIHTDFIFYKSGLA